MICPKCAQDSSPPDGGIRSTSLRAAGPVRSMNRWPEKDQVEVCIICFMLVLYSLQIAFRIRHCMVHSG